MTEIVQAGKSDRSLQRHKKLPRGTESPARLETTILEFSPGVPNSLKKYEQ